MMKNELKIGDIIESIYSGRIGIVTQITEKDTIVLFHDGLAGELAHNDIRKITSLQKIKEIKADEFTDHLLNFGYTKGYTKGVDDLTKAMVIMMPEYKSDILKIAEQLKRGK